MASFIRSISFLVWGTKQFTKDGYLRSSAMFDNSCMNKSLTGKVCIVTGANSGLGFVTSKELAKQGATLYMVCRSEARGQAAVQAVREASNNSDVHLEVCDISSLSSIAAFSSRWQASNRLCHILVNNAGVLVNERSTTADGFETSFATNTLGTAAITQHLMPALQAAAPSKVIIVSSGGMYTAPLRLDDFDHSSIKPWDGSVAYARDKRRQVVMAEHLASTLASRGVSVYSMHPGWADTEGVRTSIPGFHKMFEKRLRSPEEGADTIVWLAMEENSKLKPGAFYLDRKPQPKHLTLASSHYKQELAAELWQKLMKLAGLEQTAEPAACDL